MEKSKKAAGERRSNEQAQAACLCGAVRLEMDVPAVWAWHDHGRAAQRAQGCAYATYVGSWKSRLRILTGEKALGRFSDPSSGWTRSFCTVCGTPVFAEHARAKAMVNIPRALFSTRTGREPRYHLRRGESPDWAYQGESLKPLKGYPGVLWTGPRPSRKLGLPPLDGEGGFAGPARDREDGWGGDAPPPRAPRGGESTLPTKGEGGSRGGV
ncbi:MAG: GFA family protein [Caulobacteraceae bacterium]